MVRQIDVEDGLREADPGARTVVISDSDSSPDQKGIGKVGSPDSVGISIIGPDVPVERLIGANDGEGIPRLVVERKPFAVPHVHEAPEPVLLMGLPLSHSQLAPEYLNGTEHRVREQLTI